MSYPGVKVLLQDVIEESNSFSSDDITIIYDLEQLTKRQIFSLFENIASLPRKGRFVISDNKIELTFR